MDSCKLSVIVPVYMVEKYVAECIESIIHQTYTNLEIILVDDGSKDNSGTICDEYQRKDERIVVIHKENGGPSSARNVGIEHATGELIAFVDADDYIKIDMYEVMINCMQKNRLDIICCNYESNILSDNSNGTAELNIMKQKDALSGLLDEDGYRCYPWNKIYKRELFANVKFPVGLFYEDIVTNYRLFINADRIGYLNKKFYVYNTRADSTTNEKFSLKKYDLLVAINEVLNDVKMYGIDMYKLFLPGYVRYFFYFVNSAMRSNVEASEEVYRLKKFIKENYFSIITSKKSTIKIFIQCTSFLISEKLYKRILLQMKPIG